MKSIQFEHSKNPHSLSGPKAALPSLLKETRTGSLLDVGCGCGNWMKAALDLGIHEVFGLDGIELAADKLYVPPNLIKRQDFTAAWDLGKRFDAVMCLEVAEHLEEFAAEILISSLIKHGDLIFFSAACPGQMGQYHLNCQWPDYWQHLFNKHGFSCSDYPRWAIWNEGCVEPWYRQNMFVARRDFQGAGLEQRIAKVIHPEMLPLLSWNLTESLTGQIEQGSKPMSWYLTAPVSAAIGKISRRVRNGSNQAEL